MEQQELIPHLFRNEYRKIVSVLCRLFGIAHIEVAEDLTSDTFLLAAETWGIRGVPENPAAWLYFVAKNKAINYLKRNDLFRQKIAPQLAAEGAAEEMSIDLSEQHIEDSQLQMMFAICQPAIGQEAQIGLALRILCGFGIEEIADAFLSSKETINKRLFRAKEKLRTEEVKIALPGPTAIGQRMDTVLTTLYLLFNEGYFSQSQNTQLRKDFCWEAMRLVRLLLDNPLTNRPEVNALFSLMCFHASRFESRVDASGEIVLYEEQDEQNWNQELIAQGNYYLNLAATGASVTRYHLEAGIAFWHTIKTDLGGKWEQILQLYNHLLSIHYSPVAALNRTYALARARGNATAIAEAEQLQLDDNHLYHLLLGELYKDTDAVRSIGHLEQALALARSAPEQRLIATKIAALRTAG
ncbi:RNA polymerase sigma factor [Taibaiella koreensis]|uniref:RNA polymerase sigma factor n=1 Tax=Taibaiella koreensis TaxID=1268548 RepID=UPI000E599E28|nr:sigma-70 family RNA polymerase sigma factor [Taibaiella koreensis]